MLKTGNNTSARAIACEEKFYPSEMTRKILLIAIAYYTVVTLSACFCNCKNRDKQFIYSELKTDIYSCSISDSSVQYEALYADSLLKNKFSIVLNLNGTIVWNKPEIRNTPGLISTANACKCPEAYFSTSDTVSSIKIVTLNNFDSAHAAGGDVTEYFKVLDYDYSRGKANIIQKSMEDYFQYSYAGYAPGFYLNIYLNQFPENEGYIKLKVQITCKNGKEFEAETQEIYLY